MGGRVEVDTSEKYGNSAIVSCSRVWHIWIPSGLVIPHQRKVYSVRRWEGTVWSCTEVPGTCMGGGEGEERYLGCAVPQQCTLPCYLSLVPPLDITQIHVRRVESEILPLVSPHVLGLAATCVSTSNDHQSKGCRRYVRFLSVPVLKGLTKPSGTRKGGRAGETSAIDKDRPGACQDRMPTLTLGRKRPLSARGPCSWVRSWGLHMSLKRALFITELHKHAIK
ncbi:hypothetical protein C8Q77DRAFT_339635 [Trametes polyzona]|nr:hypothetical protein C8Q77DRAFT_339635 [Trametes polyzona]